MWAWFTYNKNVDILYCTHVLAWNGLFTHRRGCRGRDRMVVGFTTTCVISAYHHWCCEFEPSLWWGVLDTTLYDKVCQWLATDQWFSPGTPVSSTNKTDCHNITEILLKVALNTINSNPVLYICVSLNWFIYIETLNSHLIS